MNYVGEVTNLLRSRCGDTTILSPMDYVIIAEWEKQEIPLVLVMDTINELCDRTIDTDAGIESAGYFQETIKDNFSTWLQTGSTGY